MTQTLRRRMLLLAGVVLVLIASCGGNPARPGEGIAVIPARAVWDTGWFQAEVYRLLLEELGYEVTPPEAKQLPPPDAYVEMARGNVDYWVHGWFPLDDSLFDIAVEGGTVGRLVEKIGFETRAGAVQGYLVDRESAEALGIESMDAFFDPAIAAEFDVDDNGKADLFGCNVDWDCAAVIDAHLEAWGWGEVIEHVQADYDALIERVAARIDQGKPTLFYAWTPNYVLGRLIPGEDVVWIEAPSLPGESTFAEVQGCAVANPCELGWIPNDIRVVANSGFIAGNPAAATLLSQVMIASQDILDQNWRMRQGESTQGDVEQHAAEWIDDHRDLVDEWLAAAREAA